MRVMNENKVAGFIGPNESDVVITAWITSENQHFAI